VDFTVADRDFPPGGIDQQLTDPDRALTATVATAQDGGDPGAQGPISD
jgi:hypothetical protein